MIAYWWLFVALAAGVSLGIMMMAIMYVASEQPSELESMSDGSMESAPMT
jgi:hypothetical protein